MRVAIVNLGAIVSGNWHSPLATGDVILIDNGRIAGVGAASDNAIKDADVVIDAGGMTAIPGLIDSHVILLSAITRLVSAPSVTSRAICTVASPPPFQHRKCMFRADSVTSKA